MQISGIILKCFVDWQEKSIGQQDYEYRGAIAESMIFSGWTLITKQLSLSSLPLLSLFSSLGWYIKMLLERSIQEEEKKASEKSNNEGSKIKST
jgi:hypothetical protein